jgi:surface protein
MQKVTTINSMFRNCTNLVFNASINKWDISSVTNPAGMFLQCTSFNQPVSNLDFSKATTLGNLFNGCTSFNQDVSGFDTSNVTIMNGMFNGCTSFNQDVSGFNISALTSASNMFLNSGFTRTNYDKLLDSTTGWPSQSPINSGVTFSAGTAKYSAGSPATGRSFLIGTKLWTITDGGAF